MYATNVDERPNGSSNDKKLLDVSRRDELPRSNDTISFVVVNTSLETGTPSFETDEHEECTKNRVSTRLIEKYRLSEFNPVAETTEFEWIASGPGLV